MAEMTQLRDGILSIIRHGRENAITGKALAVALDESNDRRIRLVIRGLIREGIPIASATDGEPRGFFIARNQAEVKHYRASLHSRLVEDAYRLRDFTRAYQGYEYHEEPVQLPLL